MSTTDLKLTHAEPGSAPEVTRRLPGRTSTDATSYASVEDLRQALTRAAVAHGEHEARNGGLHDEQWPTWYAAHMVAEQAGTDLPL